MYEFFKSEEYFNLISGLQNLVEFYSNAISNPFQVSYFGQYANKREEVNIKSAFKFIESLQKILLTTPENKKKNYIDFIAEVRENVIGRVSAIPLFDKANSIFIEQYKIDADSKMKTYIALGVDPPPVILQKFEDGVPFKEIITEDELIEKWKSGIEETKVVEDERIIGLLCNYFEVDRRMVHPGIKYLGVDLLKGNSQINPFNLANELITSNLIGYMFKRPFLKLIQGHTYFEPIPWNGNLSELNKFIKALASMNTKSKVNTSIEWKAIAKVFLVNNDFPDSDKLKGASNSKIGISQELQPFYGICRKALNENLPT